MIPKHRAYICRHKKVYTVKKILLCILFSTPCAFVFPQSLSLYYGLRAGASAVVLDPESYNEMIQTQYPSDYPYYPIFTEIGLSATQHVQIGESWSYLSLQQIILAGAMDQNIIIPSITFLIGYANLAGFDLGVGPYLTMQKVDSELRLLVSFAYEIGWTFETQGVAISLSVMLMPLPTYSTPKLTITLGLLFRAR